MVMKKQIMSWDMDKMLKFLIKATCPTRRYSFCFFPRDLCIPVSIFTCHIHTCIMTFGVSNRWDKRFLWYNKLKWSVPVHNPKPSFTQWQKKKQRNFSFICIQRWRDKSMTTKEPRILKPKHKIDSNRKILVLPLSTPGITHQFVYISFFVQRQ